MKEKISKNTISVLLASYCSGNNVAGVKHILETYEDTNILDDNGIYFGLAISNSNYAMFDALLSYYEDTKLTGDPHSFEYQKAKNDLRAVLDEVLEGVDIEDEEIEKRIKPYITDEHGSERDEDFSDIESVDSNSSFVENLPPLESSAISNGESKLSASALRKLDNLNNLNNRVNEFNDNVNVIKWLDSLRNTQQISEKLLSDLKLLLRHNNSSIRVEIVKILSKIIDLLTCNEDIAKEFISILKELSKDNDWQVRLEMVKTLSEIIKSVDQEIAKELISVLRKVLMDAREIHSVKTELIKALPEMIKSTDYDIVEEFFPLFKKLLEQPKAALVVKAEIIETLLTIIESTNQDIVKKIVSIFKGVLNTSNPQKSLQIIATEAINKTLAEMKTTDREITKILSEMITGNGAEDYEETSFWYEYSKVAMEQLLELRLINVEMDSEVNVVHPKHVFSEVNKLIFAQDLATQIASISDIKVGSKILIPINIDNQHWVGMTVEFNEDKILVTYMDSENNPIPTSLEARLIQELPYVFPNLITEISEKEVEQQKYNNCGLEVIENLIAAVAGEAARMSQEDALAVHSALYEDNLVNEFVTKEAKSEQKTMKIAWKEVQNQQIIERAEEILLEETKSDYIFTSSKFQHQHPAPVLGGIETVKNLLETLIRFISGEPLPGGKSITDGITTMQSVPDISIPTPIIAETNLVFDDFT